MLCRADCDADAQAIYMPSLPEELQQKVWPLFETQVDRMLQFAGTREWYERLAAMMKKLRKLPGGSARIDRMLNRYREQYPRRPAMLDIFRKV